MARLETVVSRRGCFVDQPHRRKCLTMKRLCQLGVFFLVHHVLVQKPKRFPFFNPLPAPLNGIYSVSSAWSVWERLGWPPTMRARAWRPAADARDNAPLAIDAEGYAAVAGIFWRMSLAAVPGGGQAEPVCGGWAVVVGMFFSQKWMVDGGLVVRPQSAKRKRPALRSRKTRQAFADRLLPLPLNTPENRKMVIRHFTNSSRGRLFAAFLAQKAEKPRAEDYSFFVEPIGVGGCRFMHARETLTSAAGMLLVRPSRRTASWNSGQTGPAARKSACRSSGRSRAASRPRFVPARPPSTILDVLGHRAGTANTVSYARIRLR